jgi:hypothetical protein
VLLEEHLLSVAELEVLVTLLAADDLRRNDLLLGSATGVTECGVLIALLHIVNLGSDGKVKLRGALHAGKLPVLELTAILVTVTTANRLRKALLSKDLLLARREDKALSTVSAGNLLVIVKTVRLLLRAPSSLLHCLGLLMLGHRLLMVSLLLSGGLLSDHALVNGRDSLRKVRKSDPVYLGKLICRHGAQQLQLANQLIADESIVERHFWLDFLLYERTNHYNSPQWVQFFLNTVKINKMFFLILYSLLLLV